MSPLGSRIDRDDLKNVFVGVVTKNSCHAAKCLDATVDSKLYFNLFVCSKEGIHAHKHKSQKNDVPKLESEIRRGYPLEFCKFAQTVKYAGKDATLV